ncbi:MAG: hypothetical protein SGPRY_014383 [Prymnesium sp.]
MKHGRTWRRHSTVPLNGESSGVTVVKSVGEGKPAPRTLAWRVRLGSQATAGVLVGEKTGGASEEDSAPAVTGHGGNAATSEDDIKSCGFYSCASSGENTDGPSDDELRQHLDTMLYLLRVDVSATTFEHARTSVADAIAFDDQLTMLSLERSLSKGVLFQSLLEVGLRLTSRADHRIEHFALRQAGATHAQLDNSAGKKEGDCSSYASSLGISLTAWSQLCLQADLLRKLVRIKVADDNDLRTARTALEECAQGFRMIAEAAKHRLISEGDLFESLKQSPMADP